MCIKPSSIKAMSLLQLFLDSQSRQDFRKYHTWWEWILFLISRLYLICIMSSVLFCFFKRKHWVNGMTDKLVITKLIFIIFLFFCISCKLFNLLTFRVCVYIQISLSLASCFAFNFSFGSQNHLFFKPRIC